MDSDLGFQLLLFVHIMAAVVWIGGAFVGMMIGIQLRNAGDAGAMGKFCRAFAQVAGPLFGGSALVVLLAGMGMVWLSDGIAWDELWVLLGFGLWLVSAVMGATIVGKTWHQTGVRLNEEGGAATLDDVAPMLSEALTWSWIDLALRVAAVAVMVWRPTL